VVVMVRWWCVVWWIGGRERWGVVEGVSIASSSSCLGFESDLATLTQRASNQRSSTTMKAGDRCIKQHWNQSLISSPPRSRADTAESVIDKQSRSWSITSFRPRILGSKFFSQLGVQAPEQL
jgi:hypothetical protein